MGTRSAVSVANPPWTEVPAELAETLHPHLSAAVDEMVEEIRRSVPEYARSRTNEHSRWMLSTVSETVRLFVDSIGRSQVSLARIDEIYAEIGAFEARNGRSLDGLQTAIRVSGQVACRRFIKTAYRLHWSGEILGKITESIFVFLERAASAAAKGFAGARAELVTERERHRARLCALLVADPPASGEAIIELARSAGWDPPRTIGVVALAKEEPGVQPPVIPPVALVDLDGPEPYLVIPDPDGPGQDRLLTAAVRDRSAALGPTVALAGGAASLRWARQALGLMQSGVIAADSGPIAADRRLNGRAAEHRTRLVRCVDHVATLVTSVGRDLVGATAAERLAPLFQIPPARREPLIRTLLTYMGSADNAVATAKQLNIHQQTVRYRVRRLEEICGQEIFDPAQRLEIMIVLHSWVRFGVTKEVEAIARRQRSC